MAISGTDLLEVATTYNAYVRTICKGEHHQETGDFLDCSVFDPGDDLLWKFRSEELFGSPPTSGSR